MKKLIAILLLALVVFSFVSCDVDWPWKKHNDDNNGSSGFSVKFYELTDLFGDYPYGATERATLNLDPEKTWGEIVAAGTTVTLSGETYDIYKTYNYSDECDMVYLFKNGAFACEFRILSESVPNVPLTMKVGDTPEICYFVGL